MHSLHKQCCCFIYIARFGYVWGYFLYHQANTIIPNQIKIETEYKKMYMVFFFFSHFNINIIDRQLLCGLKMAGSLQLYFIGWLTRVKKMRVSLVCRCLEGFNSSGSRDHWVAFWHGFFFVLAVKWMQKMLLIIED